jgi:hypothetical protein
LVNRDKKSLLPHPLTINGWTDEEFDSIPESELIHPDCLFHWQETKHKILNCPGLPVPVLDKALYLAGRYFK